MKSITLQYEGISGSVTQQTFKGLENIETIRIIDTYIESIEQRSFVNLDVVKGNIYFSLNKIDCKIKLQELWITNLQISTLCRLGISLEKNVLLKRIPSTIFKEIPSLKQLRIVEPLDSVIENLDVKIKNLEQLRIVGSSHYQPSISSQFLKFSSVSILSKLKRFIKIDF